MKRYVIQDTTTKRYLKKTDYGYVHIEWVLGIEDAHLFKRKCDATNTIRYRGWYTYLPHNKLHASVTLVKVIELGVLLYPAGLQPFIDGVLNDTK